MDAENNTIRIAELKETAEKFIQLLAEEDFSGAVHLFESNLAQAFPATRAKEAWDQILSQVGSFENLLDTKVAEQAGSPVVIVTCQFKKTPIDFRVSFNPDGQVTGFVFQPPANETPYSPPAYVHPSAFHEVEVTVGEGEWALPGTLSLPEGSGKFPALVLVHGSGPQDRDETIGPNRPFRDLAWGLASLGIAVLRYDKRTKAHSKKYTAEMIEHITMKEEVVDDALLAAQLLRTMPAIDASQVYVLGHSLGATLAPLIGQQDPSLAGILIMGGMTRRLEDTILDQYTHIYGLSGPMSAGQKAEIEQLKEKVARVKDPALSLNTPAKDLPLGIYPAYWLALRDYHPEEVAKSLDMRIFVLQGDRDYQVTTTGDYPGWQKALSDKSNARLKVYPRLFHLFIAGDGPSTPQEYMQEGHVDQEVIEDISDWIKRR